MKSIDVIRKVLVKSIVNEKLKGILSEEAGSNLQNLETEYGRFQEHREQYVAQCRERDVKPDYEIMKKMAMEDEKFKASRAQVHQRLEEIKNLENGSEFVHGSVDSPFSVQVGDNWHSLMTGVEVVLEDGIVKELRQKDVQI